MKRLLVSALLFLTGNAFADPVIIYYYDHIVNVTCFMIENDNSTFQCIGSNNPQVNYMAQDQWTPVGS